MCTKVRRHLVERHRVPYSHNLFRDYSEQLLDYFHHAYLAALPCKDQMQAQQQAQTVASIRQKINEHKLVIRLTDKGHNFYIGSALAFEKKAEQFFAETNAFVQLTENPFNQLVDSVFRLLNTLHSKKLILKWQYEAMMPDRQTTGLAHLYFNPKTHKVTEHTICMDVCSSCLRTDIGRHSGSTH